MLKNLLGCLKAVCVIALVLLLISPAPTNSAADDPKDLETPTAPTPTEVDRDPDGATQALDLSDGRLWLCVLISIATGLCTFALIYYTFGPSTDVKKLERTLVALYMIVVALVVEAVLICAVLGLDTKRYEAIYAAIIGYVLGSLTTRDRSSKTEKGSGDGQTEAGDTATTPPPPSPSAPATQPPPVTTPTTQPPPATGTSPPP